MREEQESGAWHGAKKGAAIGGLGTLGIGALAAFLNKNPELLLHAAGAVVPNTIAGGGIGAIGGHLMENKKGKK